jgi:hypothetical protein
MVLSNSKYPKRNQKEIFRETAPGEEAGKVAFLAKVCLGRHGETGTPLTSGGLVRKAQSRQATSAREIADARENGSAR